MKEKIHPTWYPEAEVTCLACGTVWTVGATYPEAKVDICANCHPFYTGEQRIVDTEGQVDRFMKRLQERDRRRAELERAVETGPDMSTPLETFDIGKRYMQAMLDDGLETIGDVVDRLSEAGDEGLTRISGIGIKVLADVKKQLRNLGLEVPEIE